VLYQESVGLPHVARVQRVDAQHLRTYARDRMTTLRALLFGAPLAPRVEGGVEVLVEDLNACLRGVLVLLETEVGPCAPLNQAKLEWGRLIEMDADFCGVAARRAALIFALHTLEAVRVHFAADEPELVADLEQRVLPMVVPAFLAGMAQKPEALVLLTATLAELWPGEKIQASVCEREEGVGEDESARA
jgi:hypothetical protein